MKKELEHIIKIKTAISLRKLLEDSGKSIGVKSYHDIALGADIRKATVSDTFNANTAPKTTTLILIIHAMGFSMSDFAHVYDLISDLQVNQFRSI